MTAFTRNTKSACAPACPSSMCVYTIACSEHVSIEQCSFSRPHARTLTRPETPDCSCGALLCAHTKAAFISNVIVSASPAGMPVATGRCAGGERARHTRRRGTGRRVASTTTSRDEPTPRPGVRGERNSARARTQTHSPRRHACRVCETCGRTERGAGCSQRRVSSCVCVWR